MPVRFSGFVGQRRPVAVASFATLLAGAAQAAEQAHGLSGEKAAFPPCDPTHFASNLFWLALTFAMLYWLMSKVALPRLGSVLEERADTIGRDLDQAAEMQGKAEDMAQAYEKAVAEALQERPGHRPGGARDRRQGERGPAPRHRGERHRHADQGRGNHRQDRGQGDEQCP